MYAMLILPFLHERHTRNREQFFDLVWHKIMESGPITLWQIDGETVADFILGGALKWTFVSTNLRFSL